MKVVKRTGVNCAGVVLMHYGDWNGMFGWSSGQEKDTLKASWS